MQIGIVNRRLLNANVIFKLNGIPGTPCQNAKVQISQCIQRDKLIGSPRKTTQTVTRYQRDILQDLLIALFDLEIKCGSCSDRTGADQRDTAALSDLDIKLRRLENISLNTDDEIFKSLFDITPLATFNIALSRVLSILDGIIHDTTSEAASNQSAHSSRHTTSFSLFSETPTFQFQTEPYNSPSHY